MKCLEFVTRASLVLVALAVPLAQPATRAATGSRVPEWKFSLDVYLEGRETDKTSVYTPAVGEVTGLLEPVLLGLPEPSDAIECVLRSLDAHYTVVVAESGVPGYRVRWCAEIMDFKVVCIESVTLLVMHVDDIVVVEVAELIFI